MWHALGKALASLPQNLVADLRPHTRPDDSASKRLRRSFLYHLFPLRVTERALAPTTTWALGIISLTLFLVLCGTGLVLALYYVPTPAEAYDSMLDIEHRVALGGLLRRLHRVAAHALVITAALHLLRVAMQAAYRHRELNWWLGLTLFAALLGLAFTGYLLPWDQTSYWAVRVVSTLLDHLPWLGQPLKLLLLGSDTLGDQALVRFYALHVALLPGGMLAVLALHLWRVRRDGGLSSSTPELVTQPAWPHLVDRVVGVMLATCLVLMVVSLTTALPLGPPADLLRPDNPEKAPWYFLGLQELVSYSATMGGVVVPVLVTLLLFALPLLDRDERDIGVWFGDTAEKRLFATLVLTSSLVVVLGSLVSTWPTLTQAQTNLSNTLKDLLNPASLCLVTTVIAGTLAGSRTCLPRSAMRVMLGVLGVSLLWFTLLGLWRGADWLLTWPWSGSSHGL